MFILSLDGTRVRPFCGIFTPRKRECDINSEWTLLSSKDSINGKHRQEESLSCGVKSSLSKMVRKTATILILYWHLCGEFRCSKCSKLLIHLFRQVLLCISEITVCIKLQNESVHRQWWRRPTAKGIATTDSKDILRKLNIKPLWWRNI